MLKAKSECPHEASSILEDDLDSIMSSLRCVVLLSDPEYVNEDLKNAYDTEIIGAANKYKPQQQQAYLEALKDRVKHLTMSNDLLAADVAKATLLATVCQGLIHPIIFKPTMSFCMGLIDCFFFTSIMAANESAGKLCGLTMAMHWSALQVIKASSACQQFCSGRSARSCQTRSHLTQPSCGVRPWCGSFVEGGTYVTSHICRQIQLIWGSCHA